MRPPSRDTGVLLFTGVLAFLSGMCALVYEIVWTRAFTPIFGLTVYATTTVLCAFMTGLGIGSALAPRLVERNRHRIWRLYALLELGIGICALLIPRGMGAIGDLYGAVGSGVVRFAASLLILAPPTILMGITLPAMVCALRSGRGGARVGLLYGLNTVGAALGCLLVGFVLMERFGIQRTSEIAAAMNLLLAGGALVLSRMHAPQADVAPRSEATGILPQPLLYLLYFLVGVVAFGLELCWLRLLVFYLQASAHSFAILLAVHLSGLGLGALFYSRVLARRLPTPAAALRVFVVVELLVGILGAATLHVSGKLAAAWALMIRLVGASGWWLINAEKAAVAALLVFPTAVLMGVVFPLLAGVCEARGIRSHTATGRLYAVNTAGAVVGSLITGFLLFDLLGIQRTITLFSALSLAIALCALPGAGRRFQAAAAGVAGVAVLLWVATPPRMLIRQFERYVGKVLFYRESASDITFVYERSEHGEKYRALAFHDGRGTSSTQQVVNYVNRLLAYSSMAVKPDAKRVLVISFGCGNTASAFLRFPIERLDVVDISAGAFEAAPYFSTNREVLRDPRVRTHVEDGRNFLLRSRDTYDIIELELPTLHTDGVVFLYTSEFYRIAASRLAPDGLLSQWIDVLQTQREPSYQLIATMLQEFPNSSLWAAKWAWWVNGTRSGRPQRLDVERVRALFATPEVQADMRSVGTSLADVLGHLMASPEVLAQTVPGGPSVTDDHTRLDYLVPQLESPHAFGGGIAYYTSPLSLLFLKTWEKEHRYAGTNPEFVPFYADRAAENLARSLEDTLGDLPEALRLEVGSVAQRRLREP
ncbi:MAG TPA: fused MFS/spermidine synthase [Candidatus Polarisedimenticolaceae bacterium]|nr:fused MFS/spermidine synthase [Candidatus Polarisedimenticolaceae bacterium]